MPVTAATFRRLALGLPEASEGAHMGHPDFRVRNKIFASLAVPDKAWGTVKLAPEQQEVLLAAEPAGFRPAAGAWGRRGWTQVHLASVDAATLESALRMAWRNTAPARLLTNTTR
ncbi:MAG: MmcQ/YjbR family DNA-binding protein [Hyphomicrobiaceae bacterium]|nr:MmcQ/YjbR family DNA-binding protein [Hyphomicrobiaceae bacterium]